MSTVNWREHGFEAFLTDNLPFLAVLIIYDSSTYNCSYQVSVNTSRFSRDLSFDLVCLACLQVAIANPMLEKRRMGSSEGIRTDGSS